jgi:transposase
MVQENNKKSIILFKGKRYKRFTAEQKRRFIEESHNVGSSISIVARKYGIAPSCLYEWRHQMEEGSLQGLKSGETVVPLSEVKALKAKIRELERLLGQKTVQIEILKEAVEIGREKKLISRTPLQGVDGFR